MRYAREINPQKRQDFGKQEEFLEISPFKYQSYSPFVKNSNWNGLRIELVLLVLIQTKTTKCTTWYSLVFFLMPTLERKSNDMNQFTYLRCKWWFLSNPVGPGINVFTRSTVFSPCLGKWPWTRFMTSSIKWGYLIGSLVSNWYCTWSGWGQANSKVLILITSACRTSSHPFAHTYINLVSVSQLYFSFLRWGAS